MAVRYEPSILYKNYDITPVIEISDDGMEGPARYIISDIRGQEVGDPVDTLGGACRVIDSMQDILVDETAESLDRCFVSEKKQQVG